MTKKKLKNKMPRFTVTSKTVDLIIAVLFIVLTSLLILNVYLAFDLQRAPLEPEIVIIERPVEKEVIKEVIKEGPSGETKEEKSVKVTIIRDSSCSKCFDPAILADSLKEVGGGVDKVEELDYVDKEGKDLIEKYEITKIPTILFSKEAGEIPEVKGYWESMGRIAEDGTLIFTRLFPPFHNLTSGKIQGIVEATYLIDSSCSPCYDVTEHKKILDRFSIVIGNENLVPIDDSEGQKLREKYDITKIPTLILSSDISLYPGFTEAWMKVGTVEEDGTYVFRLPDIFRNATYIDLETESIVTVEE